MKCDNDTNISSLKAKYVNRILTYVSYNIKLLIRM